MSDNGEGLVKIDEGCLYQTDDAGEAMMPISLREGVTHPITLNHHGLLMDVELIDDGAFCALKDMKTNTKEYAVMRANVTQEEREFLSEYHKQSEPQGGGATGPRVWGSAITAITNSTVTTRNSKVLDL